VHGYYVFRSGWARTSSPGDIKADVRGVCSGAGAFAELGVDHAEWAHELAEKLR